MMMIKITIMMVMVATLAKMAKINTNNLFSGNIFNLLFSNPVFAERYSSLEHEIEGKILPTHSGVTKRLQPPFFGPDI